ncbi:LysM peptidoglycan-binding domain-containing protein [Kibdelosporangium philippinense]|uniref:LysM peptidoglycan-binding domain-containing protein n=1 Tax=Kibdelosporangium philippinense TaxID=211113 RepID=A0ABS8ZTZ3_9PSEU|nr:LysM peptidoglycan-binding domain-containing protein [Kibdelosporangium philippinense]MCE7011209.1 LysM peptidoglycan-binding domain-containing protein [Kibdelosporangium philippinense]
MAAVKAYLLTEGGDQIKCLFNPAELTISKSNSWQGGEAKGKNAPELRFQAGQSATMSMSLMFDTTREGTPVTEHTDKLLKLMKVDPALAGADPSRNKARPPWVEFHWGDTKSFKCIVERVQIRFTYFASSGKPLRCKADITMKQWKDEDQLPLQNPTSSTPTLHTVHQLRPGETLDRVAAAHYGDATRWRQIAEANGILDPLLLPKGKQLAIPEQGTRRRDGGYA